MGCGSKRIIKTKSTVQLACTVLMLFRRKIENGETEDSLGSRIMWDLQRSMNGVE